MVLISGKAAKLICFSAFSLNPGNSIPVSAISEKFGFVFI